MYNAMRCVAQPVAMRFLLTGIMRVVKGTGIFRRSYQSATRLSCVCRLHGWSRRAQRGVGANTMASVHLARFCCSFVDRTLYAYGLLTLCTTLERWAFVGRRLFACHEPVYSNTTSQQLANKAKPNLINKTRECAIFSIQPPGRAPLMSSSNR